MPFLDQFGMPTAEPPKKRRPFVNRQKSKAPAYAHQLKLEAALPQVLDQKLSAGATAKLVGVTEPTARQFLSRKLQDFALSNKARFFQFAPRHAAAFNGAASRQIEILEWLNEKPWDTWTEEERRLERHALTCIKSIHPFLQLAASVLPTTLKSLKDHNPTEDSPTSDSPDPEITQDDGL